MKKKGNPMTRERNRTRKMISRASLLNQKCCVWLHIVDRMDHEDIKNELFEDFMKAYQRITFQTVEISEEIPCIRSERSTCIAPEEAAIVNGELCDITSLEKLTKVSSSESQVWHFAGGIWLIDSETCFCEYDANKKEGGMMIFFDGKNILRLLTKYPQLKQKVKFAKRNQYDWLVNNW